MRRALICCGARVVALSTRRCKAAWDCNNNNLRATDNSLRTTLHDVARCAPLRATGVATWCNYCVATLSDAPAVPQLLEGPSEALACEHRRVAIVPQRCRRVPRGPIRSARPRPPGATVACGMHCRIAHPSRSPYDAALCRAAHSALAGASPRGGAGAEPLIADAPEMLRVPESTPDSTRECCTVRAVAARPSVPVQMWLWPGRSRCRCGCGWVSPGADVAVAGSVLGGSSPSRSVAAVAVPTISDAMSQAAHARRSARSK